MNNFSKNHKLSFILKATTIATSSTGVDCQVVDMSGFNSAYFGCIVASCTGTDVAQRLFIKGSTASGGTYEALSGATVTQTTGTNDGLISVELDRPTFRYLKAVWASSTTTSQRGGVFCIQSNAKEVPVTQPTSSYVATLVRVVNAAT